MTFRHLIVLPALALSLGLTPLAHGQRAATGPKVEVFKTATCGCCSKWVEHLKAEGFDATYKDIDQAELDKFGALANRWWDPQGPQKALHALNPARLGYVAGRTPLAGAKVLDVGCGGGLLSESMARAGAVP